MSQQRRQNSRSGSSGATFDLGSSGGSSGSSGSSSWGGFRGGQSGGGGASDSWGEAPVAGWLSSSEPLPSSGGSYQWGSATSGGSGGSGSFDFDLGDDGCLGIVVLLLLVALLVAIFGAGAYLIYQAPAIFGEAAFQAALASGLIKASRGIDSIDWKGSIFHATKLPFVIVLVLSIAFGWAAHRHCPSAIKAAEAFRSCKSR